MSVSEIKEQLHLVIDSIEDKKVLEAALTLLIPKQDASYTNELEEKQLKILKEREERYLKGETGTTSLEEFKLEMKRKYGL
jgi:hypothetical protein